MNGLEPIINLLIFLTALSVAAERLTNVWKLRSDALKLTKDSPKAEKDREQRINARSLVVGVAIALVLKADFVAALNNLAAPWQTLGWVQQRGTITVWAPALSHGALPLVFTVLGCVATGLALGFGSKFWHELLDGVLELRTNLKVRNEQREVALKDQRRPGP